jgi:hypothetical protein
MPIDPYAACPGGTGKKVKFCCPDLVNELATIQHMLEGEQRRACLDHVEHLDAKFPDRACLMSTKAYLQSELGLTDEAQVTVTQLLKQQPDNPIALAESALLNAGKSGAHAGIEPLQRAIGASGQQMSPQVFDTIGHLAHLLLAEGRVPAARGHLLLQIGLSPNEESALTLLMRLHGSRQMPLLFKDDPRFMSPPVDAPWKSDFESAMQRAYTGNWLAGDRALTAIAKRVPDSPAVWHNLATLRGWLDDTAGAVEALRKYAALKVPLDDAVEAEATAQLLDDEHPQDEVDNVRVIYTIADTERLQESLLSNRRADRVPSEALHFEDHDQPPPRAAFWLLDRDLPATGVGLACQDVPNIIGRAFLFGRETDREPRLEVEALRTDLPLIEPWLVEAGGASLGARASEEVIDQVPSSQLTLSWNWRLPDDTPPEHSRQLGIEQRRQSILERWPAAGKALFGGRTPADVAAEPGEQIRLLAAILLVELALDEPLGDGLVNELRTRLGVPVAGPIDPQTVALDQVSVVRLARLDLSKLSDAQLLDVYRRAMLAAARSATIKVAKELVGRASFDEKLEKASAYGVLGSLEQDPKQQVEFLMKAQAAARAAGQSCARWDLDEFVLRLRMGDGPEASRLLEHVQSQHAKEPGVRQALMQLLVQAGIISPDGQPRAPQAATTGSGLVLPGGAAAPEAGKLWTPGGETPPGKKSALWTPGMD